MPSDRLSFIDCARSIAIVAIVLVHADAMLRVRGHASLGAAATTALAVLFLISGHLTGRQLLVRGDASSIASKVAPLLWLYLLWQPVVVLQRSGLGFVQDGSIDLPGEVARFLASPIRPNGELWYLWALALHLVLVATTRRLPAWVVLAPAAGAFVVWNGFGDELFGAHTWHVLGPGLQGLPQFAFFTLLGARLPSLLPTRRTGILGLIAIGSVIGAVLLQVSGPDRWARPLETALGVAGVLCTASLATRCSASRLLVRVGRHTVAAYLMHMSILTILAAIVVHSWPASNAAGARALVLVCSTAIAVLLPVVVREAVRGSWAEYLFRAPEAVVRRGSRWLVATGRRREGAG